MSNIQEKSPEVKKAQADQLLGYFGGANRLAAMVGADRFTYDDTGIRFFFKMCKKANMIEVRVNQMDTLDVAISKFTYNKRTGEAKKIVVCESYGMYPDGLKCLFERETGLYLTLF